MTCMAVRRLLSAYVDGDLPAAEFRAIGAHLGACDACTDRHRSLRRTIDLVAELPKLALPESMASRVRNRLEVESRGPGLSLIFRSFWAARPLILPSLVPAAFVLVAVLTGALVLDKSRYSSPGFVGVAWEAGSADSGTEANPLFPSSDVSLPRTRGRIVNEGSFDEVGEGTFFLETVVARDGTVSAVTLLDGDSARARTIVDALRRERFEPVRFHGRPVAVSVYRLISRLEVRAPLT